LRIDRNKKLAGIPILEIRRLLRRSKNIYQWNVFFVQEELGVSIDQANAIIESLEKEGYVEPGEISRDEKYWRNTVKGNALALGSAAKPLRRDSAENKLVDFLSRVKQVNESSEFIYKVNKVTLFGSYLSSKERIGDIDLAVTLAPKIQDRDEFWKLNQEWIRQAYKAGRRFSNIAEELFWPQREVLLYLKSRSRSLSLHFPEDLKLAKKTKVIFEEE